MTMARHEQVITADGIDSCSAHEDVLADGTPAVQKMTQELTNRSCAGCHHGNKSLCQTPTQDTV